MEDFNVNFETLRGITLIVVHGGQTSHQDEQVASALAVAYGAANRIERRDPLETEMADSTTLVLDVGGQDNWARRNVDHHQLDRTATDCAFSLLARHLDCWPEFSHVLNWARPAVTLDQHGPEALATSIMTTKKHLLSVIGPAREYHDKRWASDYSYRHDYTEWLADQIRVKLSLYGELDGFSYQDPYMPVIAGIEVLRGDLVEKAHPQHARELTDMLADEYDHLQVVVFNDDRGPGFGILRRHDDDPVDFSHLEGDPRVSFVHKDGFLAKTSSKDVDLADLIQKAKKGGDE